jgi:hypothetical protein
VVLDGPFDRIASFGLDWALLRFEAATATGGVW